jgi:hypothetical protein
MAVYLLTYDLNKEVTRPPIVKFIKDNYAWARLSESSYAIETDMSPEATYRIFSNFLDANDQLYVIQLSLPAEGQGASDVNQWLLQKLRWSPALAA